MKICLVNKKFSIFLTFFVEDKKISIMKRIFNTINKLDDKMCNFFADPGIFHSKSKIVVRQYATLYFVIVIDQNESELAILDLIQVFLKIYFHIFRKIIFLKCFVNIIIYLSN